MCVSSHFVSMRQCGRGAGGKCAVYNQAFMCMINFEVVKQSDTVANSSTLSKAFFFLIAVPFTVRWRRCWCLYAVSILQFSAALYVLFRHIQVTRRTVVHFLDGFPVYSALPSAPSLSTGCSSDMLNKQPFLLSLPFFCLSADRRVPRELEDNWHCSVGGNISIICISSDYRL